MAAAPARYATYTRHSMVTVRVLDRDREAIDADPARQVIRYHDHGDGGGMDRPALQQMLADIQAGKVDCVGVDQMDRLSRSAEDLEWILEIFDRHQVTIRVTGEGKHTD